MEEPSWGVLGPHGTGTASEAASQPGAFQASYLPSLRDVRAFGAAPSGLHAGHTGATGIGILLGSTRVFDATKLARRNPAGPGEYAVAFREATTRAAAAGFVLEQDVDEMVAVATAAYPA